MFIEPSDDEDSKYVLKICLPFCEQDSKAKHFAAQFSEAGGEGGDKIDFL